MEKGIKAARLADQIRDYLATWTRRDFPGYFFTITQVTLKPDLTMATIWIEVIDPSQLETLLHKLKRKEVPYKHELARTLNRRSSLQLQFLPDSSADIQRQLDQLLN